MTNFKYHHLAGPPSNVTFVRTDLRGSHITVVEAEGLGRHFSLNAKRLDGRYTIADSIFVGGQAQVYKVHDQEARDLVYDRSALGPVTLAMKVFKRNNFFAQREIAILRRLTGHNGIVTFLDAGYWGQSIAMVMAYADGPTYQDCLATRAEDIRRAGSLEIWLKQQVIYLQQIAEAAGYAHQRGVVHRDIKPANIKVSNGRALLLDWGIAKLYGSIGFEDDRGFVGTPAYAAPAADPASGLALDFTADVYSIGEMIDEILTGRRRVLPVDGEKDRDYFARRMAIPITAPSTRCSHPIPEALEQISLKCRGLTKTDDDDVVPVAPYADGNALAADLTRYITGLSALEGARSHMEDVQDSVAYFNEVHSAYLVAEDAMGAAYNEFMERGDRGIFEVAQKRLRGAKDLRQNALARTIALLESVIVMVPGHRYATVMLSDLYRDEMIFCEQRKERAAAEQARQRLQVYGGHFPLVEMLMRNRGRAELQFAVPGDFTLKKQIPNTEGLFEEVVVSAYTVANFSGQHSITVEGDLGTYVVELADGTRFPFELERGAISIAIRPLRPHILPHGFAYIPEGSYWSGGLRQDGMDYPWQKITLPGFLIGQHPVTVREYIDFINLLANQRGQRSQAQQLAPRLKWLRQFRSDHGFSLPEQLIEAQMPVQQIPYAGVMAYATWQSQVRGRAALPPTAQQWEKAARGPDGRFYPMSTEFSSRWFHYKYATGRGDALPVQLPVEVYADPANGYADRSIYNVFGMVANGSEYCSRVEGRRFGQIPVMGARFDNEPWAINAAAIRFIDANGVHQQGFRLVLPLVDSDFVGSLR